MSRCVLCGKQLNNQNRTVEHIFLNSFGDTLTNNNLICKQCNSKLGDLVDASIIKDLSPLIKMVGIYGSNHGKRPSSVNISVIGADGRPYLFNTRNSSTILKHSIIKKHRINSHRVVIDATLPAKNINQGKKQFKQIVKKELSRYQKKNGELPKINGKPKIIDKKSKEKLQVSMSLHFKDYVFEILKMGAEFAISCGIDKRILMTDLMLLRSLIKYPMLNDNSYPINKFRDMLFKVYFPVKYIPSDMELIPGKIQAKLWVEDNQLLFWVSILGLLRYRVPLASNVKGKGAIEYNGEGNSFYNLFKH